MRTNSEFLKLNLTCWIRIRISNTDPNPGGDLNTDPPGSETLIFSCNRTYMELTIINLALADLIDKII